MDLVLFIEDGCEECAKLKEALTIEDLTLMADIIDLSDNESGLLAESDFYDVTELPALRYEDKEKPIGTDGDASSIITFLESVRAKHAGTQEAV